MSVQPNQSRPEAVPNRSPLADWLDVLFPPACHLCDAISPPDGDFCADCERQLRTSERLMERVCPRCALPIPQFPILASPASLPPPQLDGKPDDSAPRNDPAGCRRCAGHPAAADRVIALWRYTGLVATAIVMSKYARHATLSAALGRRLGDVVRHALVDDPPDLVTFVPTHVTRRLRRGGSGVETIAAAVAHVIERPVRAVLETTRRIDKQAWMQNERERAKNVRDAYRVRRSYISPGPASLPKFGSWRRRSSTRLAFQGRHLLVVDDVMTSGATIEQIATVLRDGGARRVSAAVTARAMRID